MIVIEAPPSVPVKALLAGMAFKLVVIAAEMSSAAA